MCLVPSYAVQSQRKKKQAFKKLQHSSHKLWKDFINYFIYLVKYLCIVPRTMTGMATKRLTLVGSPGQKVCFTTYQKLSFHFPHNFILQRAYLVSFYRWGICSLSNLPKIDPTLVSDSAPHYHREQTRWIQPVGGTGRRLEGRKNGEAARSTSHLPLRWHPWILQLQLLSVPELQLQPPPSVPPACGC